jgi:predicted kinase
MSRVIILRGLPGSGKSSLCTNFDVEAVVCSADDFFYDEEDNYIFDGSKLALAHQACQEKFSTALLDGSRLIIVDNTNTQHWEMKPYLDMAYLADARVTVISAFDGGCTDEELAERNTHGVPQDSIAGMRARFEHDWKAHDARPPWERGK